MQIKAIHQLSSDRISVTMEDGTLIKSDLGAMTELRLYVGRDLDEEELEQLKTLSRRYLARDKAIEMLSRRLMSKKELAVKLIRKGYDRDTVDYCIDWLSEHGLLDEEYYAQALSRHCVNKGYGPGRLRCELQRRGVDRELWEDTVENMPENSDKLDRFISSRLTDPEDREQIGRISAALYRRGFTWEQIRAALSRHGAYAEE